MSFSCSTVKLQLTGRARNTSLMKVAWASEESRLRANIRISSVLTSPPHPRLNASVNAAMAAENLLSS